MLCVNAPPKKAQEGGGSEVFQELKGICIALGMSKPPANITMFQFFSGIEKKVRSKGRKIGILMMLLFWWKIVLLPGWHLPLVKLKCLNCEGELMCFTAYAKRILKMILKAFSMARREVRDCCYHCLPGWLLQVLMPSLVAGDIENAELRPQEECWREMFFKKYT